MQTITSIAPDPRRQGRFLVAVDGEPRATLSVEAIDRLRLAHGKALDERLELEITRETMVLDVFDRALNMLALTARSSSDLRQRLVRKGASPEIVDVAIERLQHAGFLDDASFARQFARSKALGAGLSRRRVLEDLLRKGVASPIAADAVADVFDEEQIDEPGALEDLARRRLRSLSKLDVHTQRRRLFAYLVRRGYAPNDIAVVSRSLIGETND